MGGSQYPNLRGPFTTPGLQNAFHGPPDPIHDFGQHPGFPDPHGGYGVHGNNGMRGSYKCDCSRCLHALRGGAITLTTVDNVNVNIHGLRRRGPIRGKGEDREKGKTSKRVYNPGHPLLFFTYLSHRTACCVTLPTIKETC